MAGPKLDNDILDEIVHDLAQSALDILNKYNLSNIEKVEYCGRAMAEILAIVITAAPKDEMTKVVQQICGFLQGAVARNIHAQNVFGLSLGNDLQERFSESLFVANKPKGKLN